MTLLEASPVRSPVRVPSLDALRGAAIVLMICDHLSGLLGAPGELFHLTIGRLAMPMFFVLAGHLARRPKLRHAGIGLLGLGLPFAVPWIDSPNVLVLWALGVVVLATCDRLRVPVWLLAVLALTIMANGYGLAGFHDGYDPAALFALMALGRMLPRSTFHGFGRLPGWVAAMGRHPVAWYVGHLLLLQFVLALVWSS